MMTKLRLSFTMLLLLMASMGFAGSDTVGERNKTTEGEEVQYQLVTSDDEITTGRYLIVFTYNPNDGQALVFDGSLEALNEGNNTQQLQIENGVITTDKDIFFNINRVKGTVQSASGFYIGQTSSSNGLGQSVDTLYSHSFQMDDNGHAMICCEENGVFLGFYTRPPQRFLYGISSIQPIYLFKAVDEPNVRVTIDELGYETLYCGSYALAIPEGITASVVTNADADGNLQLENLCDFIPAATGVIIQGAPMEYEFPILQDCYEFEGENMLKGSDGAAYTHGDGKYYQLSSGDNGIGFYWGAEDGGEFINEPHKAYLLVPESDAAEYYPFDSEETNVYILGEVNENDWAPNDGVRMEYNNDEGVYTATITADGRNEGYNYFGFTTELAENNDEGGWDYIEPFRLGATGEDDFLVTDEFLGQELSLTWDDYHAFKIPEGEYTLTLNLDNPSLLIERKQSAPEDVYILGLVNGNWGDADVGVKMDYNASSGLYTATVTIGEKYSETEEYDGYIIFSNKLAENWNDWDEIESYLFGATGEDDFVMTNSLMGKNISLTYDNPQWLQIPYGEYTLNLNLDNLTLVIRKKAVNDTVFILGNIDNNDWAANEGIQMYRCKENESGKAPGLANKIKDNRPGKDEDDDGSNCFEAYITADGRDNGYNTFSFSTKLARDANDWDSIAPYRFGAVSQGDFLVTDEMFYKNLSLTYDNPQAFRIPKGEYYLYLDLDSLTLYIEDITPLPDVFILGEVNENDWAANEGVQMDYDYDRGLYTATITADGRNDGYCYFSFTTELGDDWDDITPYRFGAVSNGDFWVTDAILGTEISLTYDNPQAFRVPAGEYILTLDLDSLKLVIQDITHGYCGNSNVNNGKNVCYEVTGTGKEKTLTISKNPAAVGNDFSMADFDTPFFSQLEPAVLVINDGVTSIGKRAFIECNNLTSVTIGNSVTTIGESAFEECWSLSSLTIPNSVTTIGVKAFKWCSSMESVNIPNNVTTIGESAFYSCSSLTSVTIGSGVTTIGKSAFEDCNGLPSITIPDNVTTLGESAFASCDSLKSVTIGSGVTTIGKSAFEWCGLPSITIPDNVTTLGESAFANCDRLSSVTIPDNVTTLGESAFYSCSSLTSVTIGSGVTTLGEGAFASCESLASVTIGSGVTTIGKSAFQWCGLPSITIPDNVTTLGESAFASCESLTSVTIGSGVTTIGKFAFDDCSSLPSITIPDNVTTIDEYAFHVCRNLSSVTIGSGVKTIGNSAFEWCDKLTSLTIPQSVTYIGNNAFFWCFAMEDVYCYALPNKLTWDEGDCNDFKDGRVTRCHVYDASSWSSFESEVNVTFVEDIPVKLYDTADNSDLVGSLSNKTKEVTLADHTFFADGKWNTLCLPFSLTSLTGTPLEGFIVKELDTSTRVNDHQTGLENGTLYLNFKDATGIEAGKPYLVKKEMGDASYVPCTADEGTDAQTGLANNTFDYHGLVDGSTGRRWRTNAPTASNPCYCEFHTADAVTMTRYEIISTNLRDFSNPKVWTLYGRMNEDDEWTVIDSRDTGANPGDALPVATNSKNFDIAPENQGAYMYYRFEVTQTVDPSVANVMVVSELKLYGVNTSVIESPVFSNVTINGAAPTVVSSSDGKIAFVGSYTPRSSSSGMLCISKGNKIGRLAKGQKMGAQHAAFFTGLNSEGKPVGDVNNDSDVNVSDVTNLVNLILSNTTSFPSMADVNGDGSVTITDVTALVDIILGKSGVVINNVVTNIGLIYSGAGLSPAKTVNN